MGKNNTALLQFEKVPKKEKLVYCATFISRNISGVANNMYLYSYLIEIFRISLDYYILANFIFLFYNTLNDVLFGIYADRTNFKSGRRIPFIRFFSPLLVLISVLFWFPFPGTAEGNIGIQIPKFIQILVALFISDTINTVIGVSLGAWLPERTEDDEERKKLLILDKIGYAFGGIFTPIIPLIWNLNLNIFRNFILVGSIINAIVFFAASFVLKERPELYKKTNIDISFAKKLKQFKDIYKRKAVQSQLIFLFCTTFLFNLILVASPLLGYAVGTDKVDLIFFTVDVELFIFGMYYGSYYLNIIFLGKRSVKNFEKYFRIIIPPILISLPILFILVIFIENLSFLVFFMIGLGGVLEAFGFYSPIMSSNIIDSDELITNERREALYGSANALIVIPITQIAAIIISGVLIIFNFNQEGGMGNQPPEAIFGLQFLSFIIPFCCGLGLLYSIKKYPYKGEKLDELKKEIFLLHNKKKEEYNNSKMDKI
ncbi:MAG: MFS transporter [archaeon]|nr:MFS transporter [archaeon]